MSTAYGVVTTDHHEYHCPLSGADSGLLPGSFPCPSCTPWQPRDFLPDPKPLPPQERTMPLLLGGSEGVSGDQTQDLSPAMHVPWFGATRSGAQDYSQLELGRCSWWCSLH